MLQVAESLNLPSDSIVKNLQLPTKLIWGTTILGLGDIVCFKQTEKKNLLILNLI